MCSRRFIVILFALFARSLFAQSVNDPNLKVQKWATGLEKPTGMSFLPDGRALHPRERDRQSEKS